MKARTLAAAGAFALLVGCNGTDPNGDGDGNGNGADECKDGVCTLTGTITEDMTLTADTLWLIRGGVFVGDDENETVLTIEPGTQIFGETSTVGMLVIRRGSKIMAEGTADDPIVFSSSKEEGSRARGDWGGLILNGRAPINGCDAAPCEAFGEGGTGYYGGDDEDDSSGVLSYVRVEFAGQLVSPDNELNGIAFQGVGRGTQLDHIQVHMAKDDGVEFFGGTAEAKYLLTTGVADDNLDWTDGWRGKLQFFVAQQYDDAGDNGIEADNNGEDNTASPRSHPVLSHITLIGSPSSDQSDVGVLLREGTAANIHNAVVVGWNEGCVDIDNPETFRNAWDGAALSGELTLESSVISCATNYVEDEDAARDFTVEEFVTTYNDSNAMMDPLLVAPTDREGRDFRPADGSPAKTGGVSPDDAFFDDASFKGGVDPAADWTLGWTTDALN